MNDPKLFPELDLTVLENKACFWARDHPLIERLVLYRGEPGSTFILVAETAAAETRQDPISCVFKPAFGPRLRIKNLKRYDPRLKVIDRYIMKAQLTEDEIQQLRGEISQLMRAVRERDEKVAQRKEFLKNWTDPTCLHLQEDLQDPALYNDRAFLDEWLCYAMEPGKELPIDLVPSGSLPYVLYDKDTPPQKRSFQKSEDFPRLDLKEFQIIAQAWKSQFPVIEKLLLYQGVDVNQGKYVVDIRVNDQDPIEYRRFERDWIDQDYYIRALPGIYKNRENYSDDDWLFLMPQTGNEPLPERFVQKGKRFDLLAAQSHEEDAVNTVKSVQQTKLRPDQEDKMNCQKIAKATWTEYPLLDIVHMKKLPAIKKIVGRRYKGKDTLHRWLAEVAPDRACKGGKRDPAIRAKQEKICKKLSIEV